MRAPHPRGPWSFGPRAPADLLVHEASGLVDDLFAAVAQRRRDLPVRGRDDVGVNDRVVEAEPLPVGLAEGGRIAGVAVVDRAADGEVGVSIWAAGVLIEQ